jgi:hypothetical protein
MKVPVWRVIKLSYRDTVRAAGAMPVLMLVVVLVTFAGEYLVQLSTQVSSWNGGPIRIALYVVCAALTSPVLIAVHRFILLGEVAKRYRLPVHSTRLRRYFGYSVLLLLVWELPAALLLVPLEKTAPVCIACIVSIGLLLVLFALTTWLALLFPAIAMDAPETGLFAAVHDLRGNFWRAFVVGLMILLPALVIVVGLQLALGDPSLMADEALNSGSPTLTSWLLWGLFGVCVAILAVVAASHLYPMLADKLRGGEELSG